MITLEKARLVDWHFFTDEHIPLGNRCLIAGDNGSGKSTIVDALQYALAADLRKARFNSAAGDRKGGRDLTGYVRCKLGSDQTDYLRGDSVAHIILEFTDTSANSPSERFLAAVCVEAWTDGRTSEHFWMADRLSAESIDTRAPDGRPLSWRQFRDTIVPRNAVCFDTKKQYLRDLTNRLGVWRRMAEYNPYLEAFTRSVSFSPLTSVDAFVCDYILEDRPLDISTMKANLESYKEAEREARAAQARITALTAIVDQAAEWEKYQRNRTQQDYLKALLDRDLACEEHTALLKKEADLAERHTRLQAELTRLHTVKDTLEAERRETEAALARDDTHQLYARMKERIGELEKTSERARERADRCRLLRAQCATILERSPENQIEDELVWTEQQISEETAARERTRIAYEQLETGLRTVLAELADLEKGIRRFSESAETIRDALRRNGIDARILADLAEVANPEWANAVEGWLNSLRFAMIVPPDDFQKALEIYDSLPRSISGIALPNLARMRGWEVRAGSLAELIHTESPWAEIYLNCVLGDVMMADIGTLKNYSKAVTKDCMSYSRFTASRIEQKVYDTHWLGRAAREQRKAFLLTESVRLRGERDSLREKEILAGKRIDILSRALRSLFEAAELVPAIAEAEQLAADLASLRAELAAIDTTAFGDLEERIKTLADRIRETEKTIERINAETGATARDRDNLTRSIADALTRVEHCQAVFTEFKDKNEAVLSECERYAADRLRSDRARDIIANYDSARKGIETRADKCLKTFRDLVVRYNRDFNALLHAEIEEAATAQDLLNRLESSELPTYLEKIARARQDAEREFKDHFIARLNELIEEARESFREINETLRTLTFGRDQYRFTLEEKADRRGQIEIVRKAAEIASFEDSLFAQFADPADRQAAEDLFNRILESDLASAEMRSICDYRTYFTYDIKIRDTQSINAASGKAEESSLSRVLREKSGGEAQTPYYVAIAASFYRFFKDKPESTVRLVVFDEAFDRLDDERIGKILEFFREMRLQVLISVPTEKIEAIAPHMDEINLIIRHGYQARVRKFTIMDAGA